MKRYLILIIIFCFTSLYADWTKTYGGAADDRGESVQQTTDGGYIITGYTSSYGSGNYDVYLINVDPPENFNLVCPVNEGNVSTLRPQLIWQSTVDNIKNYDIYINDTLRIPTSDTSWTVGYDLSENIHSWFAMATDSYALSTSSSDTYSFIVNALGIEEVISTIPKIYGIEYNSPANKEIVFRLAIPELSDIQLKIYDLSGRLVSIPLNTLLSPAYYQVPFKPENKGVYFYTLESEHFNERGKFIIVE